MRGVSVGFGVAAVLVFSGASPAQGGDETVGCYAELTPTSAVAGSTGVAFSLRVYNGTSAAQLEVGAPVEQINTVAVISAGMAATSVSAPAPWSSRIVESDYTRYTSRFVYEDSTLDLGESETFSSVGDIDTRLATRRWKVYGSRDFGATNVECEPVRPGALSLTTVAS